MEGSTIVQTVSATPPTLRTRVRPGMGLAIALALFATAAIANASPWASAVSSYTPGAAPAAGFSDANAALGAPERFTGESEFGGAFQSNVTLFNPVFGTDEAVSIGEGGQLTLELSTPATNDASHLYGVDLIVFGNAGFISATYPDASTDATASLFGAGGATIEVSADGVNFFAIPNWTADGLFPTQGYLDVDAFSDTPGLVPTNFLKPVNPALTLADFNGLTYAQALALYEGSGGGTPIDISAAGLSTVTHVRFSVPDDFNVATSFAAEIDAVATVPEPATLVPVLLGIIAVLRRNRRS